MWTCGSWKRAIIYTAVKVTGWKAQCLFKSGRESVEGGSLKMGCHGTEVSKYIESVCYDAEWRERVRHGPSFIII
jgi:hypothetical protein